MRATLDALMGINRDGDKDAELAKKYYDQDVCRYYLCGLCPHDLFTNTRIDMGSCGKQHSKRLKAEYVEAHAAGKVDYSRELLDYLDKLLVECDRKIARANKRLEDEDAEARNYPSISKSIHTDEVQGLTDVIMEKAKKLRDDDTIEEKDKEDLREEIRQLEDDRAMKQATALLTSFQEEQKAKEAEAKPSEAPAEPEVEFDDETKSTIATKMAAAEFAGEEGDVDGAQRLMEEVEAIKRLARAKAAPAPNPLAEQRAQDQKLRVCDVCGAFLSIYDSDRRLADHFGGKMHLGYMLIREKIKKISKAMLQPKVAARPERERSRERDRGDRRDRDRDRDRDHRRERDPRGDLRDDRRDRDHRDDYRRDDYGRDRDRDYRRERDYDHRRSSRY